jgi:hypothetical protein
MVRLNGLRKDITDEDFERFVNSFPLQTGPPESWPGMPVDYGNGYGGPSNDE